MLDIRRLVHVRLSRIISCLEHKDSWLMTLFSIWVTVIPSVRKSRASLAYER